MKFASSLGLRHIVGWGRDDESRSVFYGTVSEMAAFIKYADSTIHNIMTATSERLMVLEAWLFTNFSIRTILLAAIDQRHVNLPDYGPKHDLRDCCLPHGFEACLSLLMKIRAVNEALPRDPREQIGISMGFMTFIMEEEPGFAENFMRLEKAFYRKRYPGIDLHDLSTPEKLGFGEISLTGRIPKKSKYARVPALWLSATEPIDRDWKRKAVRLNNARNRAAHSHDEDEVVKALLGSTGHDQLGRVRDECVQILSVLWGFSIEPMKG